MIKKGGFKSLFVFIGLICLSNQNALAFDSTGTDISKEMAAIGKECSPGAALQESSCYFEKLKQKEKEMNDLVEQSITETTNMWGKEAVIENQERKRASQTAWVTYRDGFCMNGYYTKAAIHPSSRNMDISACQLRKTLERIDEIKASMHSQ